MLIQQRGFRRAWKFYCATIKERIERGGGGKFCYKWLGPYVVTNVTKKGVATLRNTNGVELKKKYSVTQLKLFVKNPDGPSNLSQDNEKDISDQAKISTEEEPDYLSALPDEIVGKILMESISSQPLGQRCTTYNSIINTVIASK